MNHRQPVEKKLIRVLKRLLVSSLISYGVVLALRGPLMPQHEQVFILGNILFFLVMYGLFALSGIEALFPPVPWYAYRRHYCQCGQPPQRPPSEYFLPTRPKKRRSLPQRQAIRRALLIYFQYYSLLWLALTLITVPLNPHHRLDAFFSCLWVFAFGHLGVIFFTAAWRKSAHQRRRPYLSYCACMPPSSQEDSITPIVETRHYSDSITRDYW